MTRDAITLCEGAATLRAWRVDRVGDDLHIDLWTPLRGKLLLGVAFALVLVPAPLLWLEVDGYRIAHWVTATAYSLAALFCVFGVTSCAGRERVRVRRREMVVEHFDVIVWTLTQLETARGVGIWARDQWWVGMGRSLLAGTQRRAVAFGYWLDAGAAERVAEQLRAVVPAVSNEDSENDGVVRRVERLRAARTVDGAEDLVLEQHRSGLVFRGVLRESPVLSPWIVIIPVALLLFGLVPGGPTSIGMSLGGLLVMVAATFCRGGAADQVARARAIRVVRSHPDEPWRAVRMWRSEVMPRTALRRGRLHIGMATFLAVWAALALSGIVGSASTARTVTGCVFGLGAVLAIYRAQNVFFMGLTEVRLRELPYRTPGDVEIDFAVARRGGNFAGITFTLRRMVQVKRAGQPPAVGYSHIGHYDLPDDEPPPGPGEQVTARFRLPTDASGNDFEAPRPVYWELLVEGETSCGSYAESFPIPIYGGESS